MTARLLRYESTKRYLPLDELLDLPRVRVLRVLRRFDWATQADICGALDEYTNAAWQALNSAIRRHVASGSVERLSGVVPYQYRITSAGRAELARMLARSEINEKRLK